MARAEFINSILSGKLGGSVFSRNKAGYYVRRWANPTNPQTVAQERARALLGQASSSWHSLSNAEKGAWNTFANTEFKAKFGNKSGVMYSGFNAFTSLVNVQRNMQDLGSFSTFEAPIAATFEPLIQSSTAPAGSMSAQIKDDTGANLSITLTSVAFSLTGGTLQANLRFDRAIGGTGPSEVLPVFEDAVSNSKVGFVLSASLPGQQENQALPNPNFLILSATEIVDEVTAWLSPASPTFILNMAPRDGTDFKNWYTVGDMVEFRMFIFNAKGQTQPIGSSKNQVS